MRPRQALLFCCAYIGGLIVALPLARDSLQAWVAAGGALGLGGAAAAITPRFWRRGPQARAWIAAGLVAALAIASWSWRFPQPAAGDVSRAIASEAIAATVRGEVATVPQRASEKSRFELRAREVIPEGGRAQTVSGRLYVTLPRAEAAQLAPGREAAIAGWLYRPRAAQNRGSFDFQEYLARRGIFAGLSGRNLASVAGEPRLGLWQLRQRVAAAHQRGLGSPHGETVSAIALGRRAVDLPPEIREQFVQVGLAHVLAASGFHVSLLLGAVLALTRRLTKRQQGLVGVTVLAVYVGLAGAQPSILRAALLGGSALLAATVERRLDPVRALLAIATLLLLVNPLWIADLGFQLSFLATLGLVVTAPAVQAGLERWWLPRPVAGVLAVPIAVLPWVLPLQLQAFGTLAPYSIVANALAAPLAVVLTLGGIASGAIAAVWPAAGAAGAWVLWLPAELLLRGVRAIASLPGSTVAAGAIAGWQVGALYAAIAAIWRVRRRSWRWVGVGVAAAVLALPLLGSAGPQVTVLAAGDRQVLVASDRQTAVLSDGDRATAQYAVLPFLRRAGINRLALGVALSEEVEGWEAIAAAVPVETVWLPEARATEPVVASASVPSADLGRLQANVRSLEPLLVEVRGAETTWLLADDLREAPVPKAPVTVLVWRGGYIDPDWLLAARPEVAIATGRDLSRAAARQLTRQQARLFWTERDGGVYWNPRDGWQTAIARDLRSE